MATEEWRDIPGYEGHYQVSDQGNVRSLDRTVPHKYWGERRLTGKPLSLCPNSTDRLGCVLSRDGRAKSVQVHKMVLLAFVGPCPAGLEVLHYDGNHRNNRLHNLRYGTRGENLRDAVRHGTHAQSSKTHCKWGHEYTPENTRIQLVPKKDTFYRVCRTCANADKKARRELRKAESLCLK